MANINIRVDDELKKQAETMFADLGLNMSTAMTIFLKQAVRYGGIPFDVKLSDPFYSETNQSHLHKAVADLEAGKGQTHDLIEAEDE